jgi:DNA-binding MarR family transcriptional regulator
MAVFDHSKLDDVIHGRLRLGIMAYLSTAGAAGFVELRGKVNTSDGNLSTHLQKLEEAGYVRLEKSFAGKKPLTIVVLTDAGRSAWIAYLTALQAMLKDL